MNITRKRYLTLFGAAVVSLAIFIAKPELKEVKENKTQRILPA